MVHIEVYSVLISILYIFSKSVRISCFFERNLMKVRILTYLLFTTVSIMILPYHCPRRKM